MPSDQPDAAPSAAQLRDALRTIVDPCSIATGIPINLVDMGLIEDVRIENGAVTVTLQLTSPVCMQVANIRDGAESALLAVEGVSSVTTVVDPNSAWSPELVGEGARRQLRRLRPLPTYDWKQGRGEHEGCR